MKAETTKIESNVTINPTMTTTRTAKTKYREHDTTKHATIVTFDWTGCTESDYRGLAEPSVVIMAQTDWRKSVIPATTTINVHELVNRSRAPKSPPSVATITRDATDFDDAQLAASIAALQALIDARK